MTSTPNRAALSCVRDAIKLLNEALIYTSLQSVYDSIVLLEESADSLLQAAVDQQEPE